VERKSKRGKDERRKNENTVKINMNYSKAVPKRKI
jgi:hypothetical protein